MIDNSNGGHRAIFLVVLHFMFGAWIEDLSAQRPVPVRRHGLRGDGFLPSGRPSQLPTYGPPAYGRPPYGRPGWQPAPWGFGLGIGVDLPVDPNAAQPRFKSSARYRVVESHRPSDPLIATSSTAAGYQRDAESAVQAGRWEDALRLSTHALLEDPNAAEIHFFQSYILFAMQDYVAAVRSLRLGLENAPRQSLGVIVSSRAQLLPEATYRALLLSLEKHVHAHPEAFEPQVLAAYHHWALGNADTAAHFLAPVSASNAEDRLVVLIQQLLRLDGALVGPEAIPGPETIETLPPPPPRPTQNPSAKFPASDDAGSINRDVESIDPAAATPIR